MASKFRPLYDKIYMGLDVRVVSHRCDKDTSSRAKLMPKDTEFEKQFKEIVVPYWKKYGVTPKKHCFRIYSQFSDTVDPRYMPNDVWYTKIIPHYNRLLFASAFQDKCLLDITIPDVKHPETVVKCISGVYYNDKFEMITEKDAAECCKGAGECVIKPSVCSGNGNAITFIDFDDDNADPEALFKEYGANFIIQKKVKQHPFFAQIHKNSLNTVRLVTFMHSGRVDIPACVLRMGNGDSSIDNISRGGFCCRIEPDGSLDKYAYIRNGDRVTSHPDGFVFEGAKFPSYDKLSATAKMLASKQPHFKIIGWDFAMDENEDPVLIEYNLIPGLNMQLAHLPILGEYTEEALSEVFGTKH